MGLVLPTQIWPREWGAGSKLPQRCRCRGRGGGACRGSPGEFGDSHTRFGLFDLALHPSLASPVHLPPRAPLQRGPAWGYLGCRPTRDSRAPQDPSPAAPRRALPLPRRGWGRRLFLAPGSGLELGSRGSKSGARAGRQAWPPGGGGPGSPDMRGPGGSRSVLTALSRRCSAPLARQSSPRCPSAPSATRRCTSVSARGQETPSTQKRA